MDKCGHTFTNYQVSLEDDAGNGLGRLSLQKQILIGGLSGFTYKVWTAIEVMDGYSAGWGFSW